MNYFLIFLFSILTMGVSFSSPSVTDNHIKVDQFGYRTNDRKVAVINNPINGYNNNLPFSPGNNYQIRRWSDDVVIFSGAPIAWNSGAIQTQSGDKVWWFDFSSVNVAGSYYVFDVANNVGSYRFEISDGVYFNILVTAFKFFYYQRCGTPKSSPYAGTGWSDAQCHTGALQDTDCRLYNNQIPSTSKNLSGGWHDAGDYNKYVNFSFEPVIDLLLAYKENPSVWTDNFNIPESGNGIPDLLDEVKFELDWLLKMQNSNGSVLSIVGVTNFTSASPPSADNSTRLHGPATTSATFSSCAMFALGAIQFQSIGQSSYASILQTAAVNAWNWGAANQNVTFYNSGIIGAGEQEVSSYEKLVRQMSAAVFLYALTGNTVYKTFVESNYNQMHLLQWGFAYPFECTQQNMLLYYSSLAGTTVSVANNIRNAYTNSMKTNNADNLPAYINKTDAYRSHLSDQNTTWGSNTTKGRQGVMFTNMIAYNLDTVNKTNYREAALGYLNYFNGINPTALCYLTNMASAGGENSINEIYHSWFTDGSALWDRVGTSTYGPAPGFISGGPNPSYALDGCCPSGCGSYNSLCSPSLVTPPLNQPIQKSYKDWNTSWPQNSWTITEPAIYTQAAYVRLISNFVNASTASEISAVIQGYYNSATNRMNKKDTVKISMRNVSPPYAAVDSARSVVDSISFNGNFVFSNLSSGNYYVVLNHRNSIETWSKAGGEAYTSGGLFTFAFETDSSEVFGNNVYRADSSPLTFAIYNGDVNQDASIELTDLIAVFNDAESFVSGYVVTDVTGDDFVDLSDIAIVFNNSNEFVAVVKP